MLDLLDAGLPPPARGVFTTRRGGVSAPPWASLNLAIHVDDEWRRVHANRSLVAAQIGVSDVVYAQQVHGSRVAVVDRATARSRQSGVFDVDGLVTTTLGLALAILGADCLPVLVAGRGAVGAAHVGRAGLAAGVVTEVVRVMRELTDSPLVATLGPGICGGCYEVPEAMADEVGQAAAGSRSRTSRGTSSIDLVAGTMAQLQTAEVQVGEWVGGCTFEQPERFYSHRRDGITGRHGGLVWLA